MTQVRRNSIFDINENLAKAAKLSFRLPLPDKQLVIMRDASEHAAGFVLLIEKDAASLKSEAPVAFRPQRFTEKRMSSAMNAEECTLPSMRWPKFNGDSRNQSL